MSGPVVRPVLRGLHFAAAPATRELAGAALDRAPVEIAAVIVRNEPLAPAAAENRTAALLPYAPSTEVAKDETGAGAVRLVDLGRLRHRAGEVAAAERSFIAALEADEHYEPAHRAFAGLLEELDELHDARSAYLWATRCAGTVPAWLGVARIESALGQEAVELPLIRALRCARSVHELLEVGVTAAAIGRAKLGTAAFKAANRIVVGATDPKSSAGSTT